MAPPAGFAGGGLAPAPPWAQPSAPTTVTEPRIVDPATTAVVDERHVVVSLVVILAIGFLLQQGITHYGKSGSHEPAHLIRVSQWAVLGFYGVVLALAVRLARTVRFLPIWTTGPTAENAVIGALKGVVTAAGVMLALSGATGRIQVAPSVKFQFGDATLVSVALALTLLTVAAPAVEELLFRGMVAEALRRHGQTAALVLSGFLFAVWHMRFGAVEIAYYTVLGVLLGRIYFKRGLVGSIAAHAAFNGTLAVVALVFIVGPGTTISANGVTVTAPGGWERFDPSGSDVAGAAIAAHGPSGAAFYVMSVPMPPEVTVEAARQFLAAGVPGGDIDPASVRATRYPAGEALRAEVTVAGHSGELAMIQAPDGWWLAALEHGTERTRRDFEEMLESLDLSG